MHTWMVQHSLPGSYQGRPSPEDLASRRLHLSCSRSCMMLSYACAPPARAAASCWLQVCCGSWHRSASGRYQEAGTYRKGKDICGLMHCPTMDTMAWTLPWVLGATINPLCTECTSRSRIMGQCFCILLVHAELTCHLLNHVRCDLLKVQTGCFKKCCIRAVSSRCITSATAPAVKHTACCALCSCLLV